MIKIRRAGKFNFMYRELMASNLEMKEIVDEAVILFVNNPQDSRIRNHALKRRLKGKWAFSITRDVRIMYEWQGKNTVRFLAIGSHKKVYRKRK